VIFGHWASLGLRVRPDIVALDTGCVWGRALSALRLEDRHIAQCDCPELAGTAGGQ
jgi:bis(5'-nucleosyl)-tetraphosphatase (symmetrical)